MGETIVYLDVGELEVLRENILPASDDENEALAVDFVIVSLATDLILHGLPVDLVLCVVAIDHSLPAIILLLLNIVVDLGLDAQLALLLQLRLQPSRNGRLLLIHLYLHSLARQLRVVLARLHKPMAA